MIIHSDDQPRSMWKLGKVLELLTGRDGEHRAAVLQVAGQERSAKHLRRPVQRLYPLESSVLEAHPRNSSMSGGDEGAREERSVLTGPNPVPVPPVRRSERVAGQIARDRLLAQALESGSESTEC